MLAAAGGGEEAQRVLARLSGGRDPARPEGATGVRLVTVSIQEQGGVTGEDRVDLVHDTLLSNWETLKNWVEEYRRALDCRDDLESAAQGWEAAQRPAEGLPGGAQLAYYQKAEGYSGRARKFLDAAIAEERRRNRRTTMVIGALAAFLVVAITAGGFAWQKSVLAESRLRDAVRVADQVQVLIERNLQPIAGAEQIREMLLENVAMLQDQLLSDAEKDQQVLHSRMVNHHQKGYLTFTQGNLIQARIEYDSALKIAQGLVERDKQSAHWRADLAISYGLLSRSYYAAGELATTRALVEKALEIALDLLKEADPRDIELRRFVGSTYRWHGKVALEQGDKVTARTSLDAALEIVKPLVESNPGKVSLLETLFTSYLDRGEVALRGNDAVGARPFFEKAFEVAKSLSDAVPLSSSYRHQLSVAYERLGQIALNENDFVTARAHTEKALEILQTLLIASPHNSEWRFNLAVVHVSLIYIAIGARDESAIRSHRVAAQQVLDQLEREKGIPDARHLQFLREVIRVSFDVLPR